MAVEPTSNSTDPLLADEAGRTELLLGNEAIVRGAIESGVAFACGYPGTPSSEVTDCFARLAPALGIPFEYSVNEKIALEMAFAASLAGARSIVAMKHLGLTSAGDPLTTIPYIGTVAGMVIVSAGDPSCRTSPNEQDQRHLGAMVHVPVLDPSDPQEALEMTRFAFELSEQCQLPVLLRPTTRVCHTRAEVRFGPRKAAKVTGFVRDPKRFVPIPAHARRMRSEIEERLSRAREAIAESSFVRREGKAQARVAVLTSGGAAAIAADVIAEANLSDQVALVHVGAVHPLPEDWLVGTLRELDTVLVVEELSPFLEDAVRALCSLHQLPVRVLGKRTGQLPMAFEYQASTIRRALHEGLGLGEHVPEPARAVEVAPPPPRRPILCASCGHRSAFFAARAAFGEDTLYFNDIGCYTLGFSEPLHAADALLCMGAGFSLAAGVSRVTGERTVGFMGDSTFFHSGMPALLDAVKERANMVAVILDNQVTAMTGFQDSPTIAINEGRINRAADIEGIVRALGAPHVEVVDPADLAATIAAFERARDNDDTSVVIAKRPCAVFYERSFGHKAPPPRDEPIVPFVINTDSCGSCGRSSCGHRCDQKPTVAFERAMTRARSLEVSGGAAARVEVAPCASACPLFECVQGYASHIAAGQYADALELILHNLPLPGAVCRVCDRPCETACVRNDVDQPVAINDLKRFVVDWADRTQGEDARRQRCDEDHGARVAVVGAGPSGLAAAHSLRLRGYAVTLYDANDRPGGLLAYGIPAYRLPREVLDRDVARILDLGVRFEGGRRLGDNLSLTELMADSDAVYLAVGAQRSVVFDLGDGATVIDAMSFLRAGEQDEQDASCTGDVLVIGGGNSAIDAARTAVRRGAARVTIACLESRDEMPAITDEIDEAEHEGVTLRTRMRVVGAADGVAQLVGVQPTTLGATAPDAFEPVAGTEADLPVDLVIAAIGQRPDQAALATGELDLCWTDAGALRIDPATGKTSVAGLFAGGDLSINGRTVTAAIAAGLRAAWGIDRDHRGAEQADTRLPPPVVPDHIAMPGVQARRAQREERRRPSSLDGSARTRGFDEVVGGLTEEQARAEAARCMVCGSCGNCRSCLDLFGCPAFFLREGSIEIDPALCVGCGVCAHYCPNGAIVPAEESS